LTRDQRPTRNHSPTSDSIPSRENDYVRTIFISYPAQHLGFEHPDWYNGFEHDPGEAARVRVRLLRELAANRESLVATHLSFPSVCHVAVDGDVFRWVPGPWEY
jgi:hypothetical protein